MQDTYLPRPASCPSSSLWVSSAVGMAGLGRRTAQGCNAVSMEGSGSLGVKRGRAWSGSGSQSHFS
jgi:hypothetical protein